MLSSNYKFDTNTNYTLHIFRTILIASTGAYECMNYKYVMYKH